MRYLHYDVFTDRKFEGNQLAVFHDARGLSKEQMQAITKEMNFSECTFIFPSEAPGTDVRMRIFTPSLKRKRRSSTMMPPSGRDVASVTSKPPIRFRVMLPGAGPPMSQPCRLPAPLAVPSANATSVPFNRPALMTVNASIPRLPPKPLVPPGRGTVPEGGPNRSALKG